VRDKFNRGGILNSQKERVAVTQESSNDRRTLRTSQKPNRPNSTVATIDDFVTKVTYTLTYLADTLEKGHELNYAMDRIASLTVDVFSSNPVVKAVVTVTKKVTEMVIAEMKKTGYSERGDLDESASTGVLNDSFIKSTVTSVLESPGVQDILKDVLLSMSKDIGASRDHEDEVEKNKMEDSYSGKRWRRVYT
jgi:hypothetical protein